MMEPSKLAAGEKGAPAPLMTSMFEKVSGTVPLAKAKKVTEKRTRSLGWNCCKTLVARKEISWLSTAPGGVETLHELLAGLPKLRPLPCETLWTWRMLGENARLISKAETTRVSSPVIRTSAVMEEPTLTVAAGEPGKSTSGVLGKSTPMKMSALLRGAKARQAATGMRAWSELDR